MEAVASTIMFLHLHTAQRRNSEEGHHAIKNRSEVPKDYKNVQAGLLKYFVIELKK